MGWVRKDDRHWSHPKVMVLSDKAYRLDDSAMQWASAYLTDGQIDPQVPSFLVRRAAPAVAELVAVGRWHLSGEGCGTDECIKGTGQGWVVHDYLAYNPSRADSVARSEAKAMAGAMGAASRWGMAKGTGRGRGKEEQDSDEFERFWQAFPAEGRRDKPKVRVAFRKALATADAESIIRAAGSYAADPNRDPGHTKYAQGWLSGERWNDPPLPTRLAPGMLPSREQPTPEEIDQQVNEFVAEGRS